MDDNQAAEQAVPAEASPEVGRNLPTLLLQLGEHALDGTAAGAGAWAAKKALDKFGGPKPPADGQGQDDHGSASDPPAGD